jgi:hypothetical protein
MVLGPAAPAQKEGSSAAWYDQPEDSSTCALEGGCLPMPSRWSAKEFIMYVPELFVKRWLISLERIWPEQVTNVSMAKTSSCVDESLDARKPRQYESGSLKKQSKN